MVDDRVSIELIDAGTQKDRIAQILSKVKGLAMPPQQIVSSTPCTVATNVPRPIAEKLQGFLEQAGAMVMLESEEQLFSAAEFPLPEEGQPEPGPAEELPEPSESAEFLAEPGSPESAEPLPEIPEPDFLQEVETEAPAPAEAQPEMQVAPDGMEEEKAHTFAQATQEPVTEKKVSPLQQLLSKLPRFGGKKEQTEAQTEQPPKPSPLAFLSKFRKPAAKAAGEAELPKEQSEAQMEQPPKPSPLAFLSKFRKPAAKPADEAELPAEAPAEIGFAREALKPKTSDLLSNPVVVGVVGFLAGAVVAGFFGWLSIQSLQKERMDYEAQTVQQIEQHSADLKKTVQQLLQETKTLTAENTTLKGQIVTLTAPRDEVSRQGTDASQETLVKAFQELMAVHIQSLENGYAAQKQADCTQQLLLDGKGIYTYAQVVKKFSSQYTTYDILRSNSLLTPYIAELKIAFQQEIRTGETAAACQAATLQQLATPPHHEFGEYYGYWKLDYVYKNGKWAVKQAVTEKNRALYESAFQKGSPDYARFVIDTDLFPEFKPQ
jgi:regulator of replication initiation timing